LSELRANTISAADGTSPAALTKQIAPKAFGKWVGTDAPPALDGSFNMASITDNGAGDYTLTFTNTMADANYHGAGYSGIAARAGAVGHDANDTLTASAIRLNTHAAGSSTAADSVDTSFAVMGDLA